ncbi:MAG: ABC transporter permease [Gemmatimonadales bacterium]
MTLETVVSSGWAAGFRNFLGKEMAGWWRTRRWLVHLVLWQVVITGFVVMVTRDESNRGQARALSEAFTVFFQVGGFFGLIGAVLVSQGSIVGEKNSGTAAWVLTKPIARPAFILAKFVAITFTFLLLSLLLPSLTTLVASQLLIGTTPAPEHFFEAVGLAAVHQTFYIAFTLFLGTVFGSRGPVAGVALGFWIGGQILINYLPKWFVLAMPWLITNAASKVARWEAAPVPVWIPVASSAALAVGLVLAAVWRFGREEF